MFCSHFSNTAFSKYLHACFIFHFILLIYSQYLFYVTKLEMKNTDAPKKWDIHRKADIQGLGCGLCVKRSMARSSGAVDATALV
jgi:hypothetical protein